MFNFDPDKVLADFKDGAPMLAAIGDETRQLIVGALLGAGCEGMRVGRLMELTHLSRPSLSHHLKILKEAGVVGITKEGTKNYYYLDGSGKLLQLKKLAAHIDHYLDELRKAGYHV
ncbi:ArsR/SmtB family transcription factor [Paenibacillus sp. JDR-2]|uniref:ArsR/SmtB family transcription factor n=1 Tax=Paenibacillus sp. (strain JDR-2) TaxID=324057 RepID=UPI00016696D8|nr:metalloregulator ArsR/SmtB family transcription factor [Paenibacillus sp. JDR-2]ACT01648.1 transcriptional regulator, ArsR family [Paenibacillus sp. JDR-2]